MRERIDLAQNARAGLKPGREHNSEITIFESDGSCIAGAVVTAAIYVKLRSWV